MPQLRFNASRIALSALLILLVATPAVAQRPDSARVRRPTTSGPIIPDSLKPPISPRRAFLYSALLPGYGQAILGRNKAAAAMLAIEAMAIAMIRESAADVREARRMSGDSVVVTYVDPSTGAPLPTRHRAAAVRPAVRACTPEPRRGLGRFPLREPSFLRCRCVRGCEPLGAPRRALGSCRARRRDRRRVARVVTPEAPVGIFDSGIGGLTVAHAVMRQLPHESVTYFGDTARVPYGPEESRDRPALQPRDRRASSSSRESRPSSSPATPRRRTRSRCCATS